MDRANHIGIKYYAVYIVCFFLIACNTNTSHKTSVASHKTSVAKDKSETKLEISSDLGDITAQSFEGTISHGSYCHLIVYKYEHSGDGVFSISILNANKELFTAEGLVYTLKGENDITEWECITNGGKDTFNFSLDLDNGRIFMKPDSLKSDKLHPLHLISTKTVK